MAWHAEMPDSYKDAILTGDCRDLARAIPDESVDLVIADPPYFRVADADWDRQWANIDAWADWCLGWAREMCRILRPNGSAYLFGDDRNIAYMQVRTDQLDWGLLNSIVWSKTNYTMLKADPDAMRSYRPQGEERILFYGKDIRTYGDMVVPIAAAPMARYIRQERERAGLTRRQVATCFPSKTGGLTGCVTNWEEGYNFPTPDIYDRLRLVLNERGINPNGSGEYLRRGYEELRRPFTGGRFTDVWVGPLMPGFAKQHICEKPEWLMRRIVESSTQPGAIVVDPFAGSAAGAVAAYQLGRHYIAFELDPEIARRAHSRVQRTQPPLFVPTESQLSTEEVP